MRARSTAVMFLFAAGGPLMSDQPAFPNPPKGERYVYVENTDRWVGVIRGEWCLVGKLDKNGDFIHEMKFKQGQPASSAPAYGLINYPGVNPRKAYEFRSGMLVPGELQVDGRFVPEAGRKVIPFKDYDYYLGAPPIWNLPGAFVPEKDANAKDKKK
jgi:hypothetical protein